MKRNKTALRVVALLLAAILALSLLSPALAAGSADTIYIDTPQDLVELSRKCSLDTWSQGKTVYLRQDISLDGVNFDPIPTFGGTFEGGGHTISGLTLTGPMARSGLFESVQSCGTVKHLIVTGVVDPAGDPTAVGGLVAVNYGSLVDCAFRGTVNGRTTVGGVTGRNEVTGQVINCSFSGTLTGEHYAGGIVGQNYGSLTRCANLGSVNTTEVEVETQALEERSDLRSTEAIPAGTDIGGWRGTPAGSSKAVPTAAM